VTPSLRLAETYTDNVFLSPDGLRQSDWVTQVIPRISVTGHGPRLRLDAAYAPEIVYHAQTEREDKVFHRGNAVGTLELADELLFLEAGARVDQYDISLQEPLTTSNINVTGNRATAATTYVSPYLLRNIGSAARAEARFTYSTWQSDEDEPTLPDNTARRVLLRLTNGPAYGLLTWDVAYSGEKIDYETQQETTSEEFTASAQRRITRAVSLVALAGYERYDTGIEVLAEPRWSAGFEWTPSPSTRLAVTAGRRLNDETYSFQFNHRTRLSTWSVTYAEDVTTSREQFFVPATQSTASALDQMFLSQYPDPVARQKAVQDFMARMGMGLPPSLCSTLNSLSDQLFLQKRWLASVALRGARNTVVATACWESRELAGDTVAPAGDFAASGSIRTSGASLAWGLRMTARNTWNLEAGYTRSELRGSGQVDDFVYLQAGLTRQFQPRVSGSLYYRIQNKDSTQTGAEYTENSGVASLLVTF
jgi:uncharacterized protein (PEP-CTERM system associated)